MVDKLFEKMKSSSLKNIKFSLAYLRCLFLCDLDNQMFYLKKKGVFRPSNFHFETKAIKCVLNELKDFELKSEEQAYLNNISNLVSLTPEVKSEVLKIEALMKPNKHFLKTILAHTELRFFDLLKNDNFINPRTIEEAKLLKNKES